MTKPKERLRERLVELAINLIFDLLATYLKKKSKERKNNNNKNQNPRPLISYIGGAAIQAGYKGMRLGQEEPHSELNVHHALRTIRICVNYHLNYTVD